MRDVRSLDLSPEPEGADRPELTEVGGGRRSHRELPDPEERSQAYEAALAYVDGDLAEREVSYRDEVPRFLRMWADHLERWPEERRTCAAVDRSADPPGSYRSDGGFYLSPDRNAEADEGIGRVREAEAEISADVRAVEQDNTADAWLEGFESRLKGDDRLKEKIAEQLEAEPGKSAHEALRQVPDAIRYTFCLQAERYASGYYAIKEQLETLGYDMYASRNSWSSAEYRGINTRWVTPAGQRFEVQCHTPESFDAKQNVTHRCYERLRNPLTSDAERRDLKEFQREVSAVVRIPDGIADIPDFRKKGM
jgi:hypothetical protein